MSCRTFATLLTLILALGTSTTRAQETEAEPAQPPEPTKRERQDLRRDIPSLAPPATTPEMWFYEQERIRSEDPKTIVRRNAEYRYAQMQRRIESMKWYGMSASRPIASPNPWYDTYSPYWTGNSWQPYEWSGGGHGVTYRPGIFIAPGY